MRNVRRDEWQANHKSVTYVQTSRLLTDLKKREETAWLKEVDSMALQESLRNLDRAYPNFFKLHAGYPHFKSKHAHSQSYRTRSQGNGIRILAYKTELHSGELLKVDTFYPSSQTCHVCGYRSDITKNLGVRDWDCDTNAAKRFYSQLFTNWKRFEVAYVTILILLQLVVFAIVPDSPIGMISGVAGIIALSMA